MSNFESPSREDPEALIDLLEDIVASYQDNDSRPADALNRYRQRLQLGSSYRVELAKRLVIVDGGLSHRKTGQHRRFNYRLNHSHLRLVPKSASEPTLNPQP